MKPFDQLTLSKEEYQEGWTEAYSQAASKHLWKQEPIEFLPRHAAVFKQSGVKHILDVGCGDGRNAMFLLQNGFQVTGIDLSIVALTNALAWTKSLNVTGGTFVKIDIESFPWPFPEGSFDAVVCLDVFGQILELERLVSNFHRVVKEDGYILVNLYTPRDDAFGMGVRLGDKSFLYKNTLWRFFNEEDIRSIFNRFEIVSLEPLTWTDPPHPGYRDESHDHDSYVVLLRKAKQLSSEGA